MKMKVKAFPWQALLSLMLALALFVSVSLVPSTETKAAPTFSDVPSTHWAHDDIYYCVGKNLFAGTSATTFSPDAVLTEEQLAVIIARYAGADTSGGKTWYAKAKTWVKENLDWEIQYLGYTNQEVNRELFASIMYKLARYMGRDVSIDPEIEPYILSKFTDCDRITARSTSLKWAVASGLLTGTSETTLSPTQYLTRAQLAVILARYDSGECEPVTSVTKPVVAHNTPEDARILQILEQIREEYPSGTPWGLDTTYTDKFGRTTKACDAFVAMCRERVFGATGFNMGHKIDRPEDLRVGDLLTVDRANGPGHIEIVIGRIDENGITMLGDHGNGVPISVTSFDGQNNYMGADFIGNSNDFDYTQLGDEVLIFTAGGNNGGAVRWKTEIPMYASSDFENTDYLTWGFSSYRD